MLKRQVLDNKMDVFTINNKNSGWTSLDVNWPSPGVFLVKFNDINIDNSVIIDCYYWLLLTIIEFACWHLARDKLGSEQTLKKKLDCKLKLKTNQNIEQV